MCTVAAVTASAPLAPPPDWEPLVAASQMLFVPGPVVPIFSPSGYKSTCWDSDIFRLLGALAAGSLFQTNTSFAGTYVQTSEMDFWGNEWAPTPTPRSLSRGRGGPRTLGRAACTSLVRLQTECGANESLRGALSAPSTRGHAAVPDDGSLCRLAPERACESLAMSSMTPVPGPPGPLTRRPVQWSVQRVIARALPPGLHSRRVQRVHGAGSGRRVCGCCPQPARRRAVQPIVPQHSGTVRGWRPGRLLRPQDHHAGGATNAICVMCRCTSDFRLWVLWQG